MLEAKYRISRTV